MHCVVGLVVGADIVADREGAPSPLCHDVIKEGVGVIIGVGGSAAPQAMEGVRRGRETSLLDGPSPCASHVAGSDGVAIFIHQQRGPGGALRPGCRVGGKRSDRAEARIRCRRKEYSFIVTRLLNGL